MLNVLVDKDEYGRGLGSKSSSKHKGVTLILFLVTPRLVKRFLIV